MNYYDMTDEQKAETGIDYDLCACLEYNQQSFTAEDVTKVLAVHEGENDGDDWRWVLRLNDGRFVFLQGGCDYTGWDCQSWATSQFADAPEGTAQLATKNLNDYPYADNAQSVYDSLMSQLQEGKAETWREKTDKEMGL